MTFCLSHLGRRTCIAVVLCAFVFSGCDRLDQNAEDRDPVIKRARERANADDFEGAIEYYQKALNKRPGQARIHWEMASLYDQELTNDLRAIYHYQRYLELEPKADRRELVEQLIGAARMSYAASLPARPSEAVQEIARLHQEIDDLKKRLDDASAELVRLKTPAVSTAPSSPSAPVPAAPSTSPMEMYVVKPGDTLSRIAGKVYGDQDKWQLIYDANRSTLPKPESVKVGQSLVIPR